MDASKIRSNNLVRLLAITMLVFFTTGFKFLGIDFGCDSSGGGGKKTFSLADGIYDGTVVFEGEEQAQSSTGPQLTGLNLLSGGSVSANSHTEGGGGEYGAITLIGKGRAILFSKEVLGDASDGDDDEPVTSHVGASGRLSLKKVDTAGDITFEGTADGAMFDEGLFDSSLMLFNVVFSDFVGNDEHPEHEGDPSFTGPGHPGHVNADFSSGNGAMGNYDADFLAELYNLVSELGYLANGTEDQYRSQGGGGGSVFTVAADGSFMMTNPGGTCSIDGQFSIIDAAHNLYNVTLTITNAGDGECTLVGSYTGLAYATFDEGSTPGDAEGEDDTANTIVLSVTSGESEGARHVTLELTRECTDCG